MTKGIHYSMVDIKYKIRYDNYMTTNLKILKNGPILREKQRSKSD